MANGPRRRPRNAGGPVSDIERFLMEVERLRKKSAAEHTEDVDLVDEVEVVRPAPKPVEKVRSVRRIEAEPVAEVVPVRPAPAPELASAPMTAIAVAAPSRKMTSAGRVVSPLIQQVVSMLSNRQQTRGAILLSEILSPPLSRRRR